MDNITQLILIGGIILISAFSMKLASDAVYQVEKMNEEIQIMFIKS